MRGTTEASLLAYNGTLLRSSRTTAGVPCGNVHPFPPKPFWAEFWAETWRIIRWLRQGRVWKCLYNQ